MGLVTIGGQSAYIIDSKPAETGRTSTGVGYAQLVSQQRWKIWEEAQKQVLRQMEFEKMGYEAQLDAYAKQKEQLTKSLARAQEMKAKVAQGSASYKDLIRLAEADSRIKLGAAGSQKTTEVVKDAVKRSGKPIKDTEIKSKYTTRTSEKEVLLPSQRLAELGGLTGIKSPKEIAAENEAAKAEEVKKAEDEWNNQYNAAETEAKAAAEAAGVRFDKNEFLESWKKGAGKEIEEFLAAINAEPASSFGEEARKQAKEEEEAESDSAKYIQSLEDQIAQLEMPKIGFDTNVLSRTRETFGGMAGVGGLGFAPRPSKISPIYDEERAKEAMAAQAPGFNEAITLAASKNADDIKNRILKQRSAEAKKKIEDYEALGGLESDDPENYAKLKQQRDNPSLTIEEEANIARTSRNAALQDFRSIALETGPGPRTRGEFMDKEPSKTGRIPDEPRKDPRKEKGPRKDIDLSFLAGLGALGRARSSDVYFGSGEGGEAGISGTAPEGALTVEGRQFAQGGAADSASIMPGLTEAGFGATNMPESGAPREPSESDSEFRKTIQRLRTDIGGMQPGDSAPSPVAIGGEAGLGGPSQRSPYVDAQELWFKYAPINYTGDTGEQVQLTDKEKRQIADKFEKDRMTQSLRTKKQIEAWYKNEVDMLQKEPQTKTKAKTRSETYASNLLKIIKTGKDLADRPAKLSRIAKPDLPEKERSKVVPEHILLVDKLYNINKGRSGAFKSTYDEIERVYKTDEKKKKAALEYLAAKEILTSEMA